MTEQSIIPKETNDFIDAIEDVMVNQMVGNGFELKDRPVVNTFTKDLYSRAITMMPGDRVTSKIHKTEHQFVILQGSAIVFDNGEQKILTAPFVGITKAGTRRVLMIPEDSDPCIWVTFHSRLEDETVEQIEDRIIEKHDNPAVEYKVRKEINY